MTIDPTVLTESRVFVKHALWTDRPAQGWARHSDPFCGRKGLYATRADCLHTVETTQAVAQMVNVYADVCVGVIGFDAGGEGIFWLLNFHERPFRRAFTESTKELGLPICIDDDLGNRIRHTLPPSVLCEVIKMHADPPEVAPTEWLEAARTVSLSIPRMFGDLGKSTSLKRFHTYIVLPEDLESTLYEHVTRTAVLG